MNILIIEDNKTEALIFAQTLRRMMEEPVSVRHKGTLADALDALRDDGGDLDLVFLDLKLPDSTEWEQTYDAVAPYAKKVPLIVMSGNEDQDVARTLLKKGAEDYIVKGGKKRNIDVLKETIDYALCRHESVRKLADEAEQDTQCIHWLTGGYSVED